MKNNTKRSLAALVLASAPLIGGCGGGAYYDDPRQASLHEGLVGGFWEAYVAEQGKSEVNVYTDQSPRVLNKEEEDRIIKEAVDEQIKKIEDEKFLKRKREEYARKLAEDPDQWINRLNPSYIKIIWPKACEYNPDLPKKYSIPEED